MRTARVSKSPGRSGGWDSGNARRRSGRRAARLRPRARPVSPVVFWLSPTLRVVAHPSYGGSTAKRRYTSPPFGCRCESRVERGWAARAPAGSRCRQSPGPRAARSMRSAPARGLFGAELSSYGTLTEALRFSSVRRAGWESLRGALAAGASAEVQGHVQASQG